MMLLFVFVLLTLVPFLCLLYKIHTTVTTRWCRNHVCLVGKTVIVTGGSTGIGYNTAANFAQRGARVILACRNGREGENARLKMINETGNPNIVLKSLDLASFASVRNFAKSVTETESRLDILVNNAAILEVGVHTVTKDGYLSVMQVNYLSQFLLTLLLIGLMKKTPSSRIVNISSITVKFAHGFDVEKAFQAPGTFNDYSYSKLCMVLFTAELGEKLKNTGITVYSADPGIVNTEIFKQVPKSTKHVVRKLKSLVLRTREAGAQTSVYCATERGIERFSGENFVNCRPEPRGSTVVLPGLAKRLWEVSAEIVKLEHFE